MARMRGPLVVAVVMLVAMVPANTPDAEAQDRRPEVDTWSLREELGFSGGYVAVPMLRLPGGLPDHDGPDVIGGLFPEYKALAFLACPAVPSPVASADVSLPWDADPGWIVASIEDYVYGTHVFYVVCVYNGNQLIASGDGWTTAITYAGNPWDRVQLWVPAAYQTDFELSLASVGDYSMYVE